MYPTNTLKLIKLAVIHMTGTSGAVSAGTGTSDGRSVDNYVVKVAGKYLGGDGPRI